MSDDYKQTADRFLQARKRRGKQEQRGVVEDAYMKSLGFEKYKSSRDGRMKHHQIGKGGGRLNQEAAQAWARRHRDQDREYADVDVDVISSGTKIPGGAIGRVQRGWRNWKRTLFRGASYIPAIFIVVFFSMLAYLS